MQGIVAFITNELSHCRFYALVRAVNGIEMKMYTTDGYEKQKRKKYSYYEALENS